MDDLQKSLLTIIKIHNTILNYYNYFNRTLEIECNNPKVCECNITSDDPNYLFCEQCIKIIELDYIVYTIKEYLEELKEYIEDLKQEIEENRLRMYLGRQ